MPFVSRLYLNTNEHVHTVHAVHRQIKLLSKRETKQHMTIIFHMQQRSEKELKKVLTAEDAPVALRVVLHDAATFDVATGKGGLNGSIVNRQVPTLRSGKHKLCMNNKKNACKSCIGKDGAAGCIRGRGW